MHSLISELVFRNRIHQKKRANSFKTLEVIINPKSISNIDISRMEYITDSANGISHYQSLQAADKDPKP